MSAKDLIPPDSDLVRDFLPVVFTWSQAHQILVDLEDARHFLDSQPRVAHLRIDDLITQFKSELDID